MEESEIMDEMDNIASEVETMEIMLDTLLRRVRKVKSGCKQIKREHKNGKGNKEMQDLRA